MLALLAPTTVALAGCWWWNFEVGQLLGEAAYAWDVGGTNTQVVVWCVWWPAWVTGMVLLYGRACDIDARGPKAKATRESEVEIKS